MQISTTEAEGSSTIKIEGDLLISCVAEAKPQLEDALGATGDIRLDLGALGEIDTAGLQLLLMLHASARKKSRRLVIVARPATFSAALERIGIPVGHFPYQEGTN